MLGIFSCFSNYDHVLTSKVLFRLFNAELQRHLLTVESGKCAVHSAVVGVSYKTMFELVRRLFHKCKIFRQAT